MNSLQELARIAKAYAKAIRKKDSVVFVNDECVDQALEWLERDFRDLVMLGIKDTDQIPHSLLAKLRKVPRIVWMSVDKMAAHGRAIDVELANPVTGKTMTGSSSGSVVNILHGITDAAVATDGGGSILAPALSAGLVGINGKGMGMHGQDVKVSTDGFEFSPGIGVLGRDFETALFVFESMLGTSAGSLTMPIRAALSKNALERIPGPIKNQFTEIVTFELKEYSSRNKGIEFLDSLFKNYVNLVISYEGPVDQRGLGDSIIGGNEQDASGKYLLKCGNIVNATSIAIPSAETGCGFIIQTPKGIENGIMALTTSLELSKSVGPTDIYKEYFRKMAYEQHKGFLQNI
ncbi:amidase family protein [Neobacillus terrae]|uniref:amidase family protein n=1 Tax=Neobacillus terrae TaxID=3034837 RepID=UPI0014077766|nr:amidase family protein [Neobacillus terrae]NHM31436.1 hypothetical protein [Neobacillus terrae]